MERYGRPDAVAAPDPTLVDSVDSPPRTDHESPPEIHRNYGGHPRNGGRIFATVTGQSPWVRTDDARSPPRETGRHAHALPRNPRIWHGSWVPERPPSPNPAGAEAVPDAARGEFRADPAVPASAQLTQRNCRARGDQRPLDQQPGTGTDPLPPGQHRPAVGPGAGLSGAERRIPSPARHHSRIPISRDGARSDDSPPPGVGRRSSPRRRVSTGLPRLISLAPIRLLGPVRTFRPAGGRGTGRRRTPSTGGAGRSWPVSPST